MHKNKKFIISIRIVEIPYKVNDTLAVDQVYFHFKFSNRLYKKVI